MPELSLAIPTYNRLGLLKRALASALAELESLGARAEVLVSDNASSDGTGAWLRALPRRPGLRLLLQRRNLGMVGNWNALLRQARGRVLTLLHDDDALLPGFGRCVLEEHRAHAELGFSCGPFRVLRGPGLEGRVQRPLGSWQGLLEPARAYSWIVSEFNPVSACSVALDRRRLQRLGGFRPQAGLAADADAYLRLAARAPVLVRPAALSGFGFHGANLQAAMDDEATARGNADIARRSALPLAWAAAGGRGRRRMALVVLARQHLLNGLSALAGGKPQAARAAKALADRAAGELGGRLPASSRRLRRRLDFALGLPAPLARLWLRLQAAADRRWGWRAPSPEALELELGAILKTREEGP